MRKLLTAPFHWLLRTGTALIAFVERSFRGAMHELGHPARGQIPALDALRTLAVLLVVVGHSSLTYTEVTGSENAFSRSPVLRGGWVGIDLFFVLSGYFIGKQLWRELRATSTIQLQRFILRRGFRIWPLYFFVLLFVLFVLGRGNFPFGSWWSDPLFLTNYLNRGVVLGSWSLCTEEQFYILAPLLLLLGAAWKLPVEGYRKYLWGLLLLLPLGRAVSWWALTGDFSHHDPVLFLGTLYAPIHAHSDGLVMGLLLANYEVAGGDKHKRGFFASAWCLLATLTIFFLFQKAQREVLSFTGVTLFFGALVWYLLAKRRPWLAFLDSWIFYLISRLSYGMYLNHGYLIEAVIPFGLKHMPWAIDHPILHNLTMIGISVVLSVLVAFLTFCLIEYPFLRMRENRLGSKKPEVPKEDRLRTEGQPLLSESLAGCPADGQVVRGASGVGGAG